MGDRHYSLEIQIFKIVIIFFMPSSIIILEISAAESLGISKYAMGADSNTSSNSAISLNVTHPCKDLDNQNCKRKACPLDPSQPGCILISEPKPNISEIYKLEQRTRY